VTARGPVLRGVVMLAPAAAGSRAPDVWGCEHVGPDGAALALCECGHAEEHDARVCALERLDRLGRVAHGAQRHHLGNDVTAWGDLTDAERDAWRMAGLSAQRGRVVR